MSLLTDFKRVWNNLLYMDERMFDNTARARLDQYDLYDRYYQGDHRRQFKAKFGQPDDNMTLNFAGLVVERSLSLLLGDGLEFDLPGEDENDPNQVYIDDIWRANKQGILLHKLAQYASVFGTGYYKIIPEGVESRTGENILLPRIVALHPGWMTIETHPEDIEQVHRYIARFNSVDMATHEETARRETTEMQMAAVNDDVGNITGFEATGWLITNEYASQSTGGKWQLMDEPQLWPYEFPPIGHWQNLPQPGDCYGQSDLEDIIGVQDDINFIGGNIKRIIRYHGHPRTWGRSVGNQGHVNWGPDEMVTFSSPDATLQNLEMQSDLASSREFYRDIKQALFDITRTVDTDSLADKLGSLTNFGLRVLYGDALAKLHTKQELMGEALTEINHRMLVIGGVEPSDGGKIIWGDPLPANETEEVAGLTFDLDRGLLSKQTAGKMRGYDYEAEQERIAGEKQVEQEGENNIGALLLKNFNKGQ